MAKISMIQCPDCSSVMRFAFGILAVGIDEDGNQVIALMLLARCKYCYEMRGDTRSIRTFIDMTIAEVKECIEYEMPIVSLIKQE